MNFDATLALYILLIYVCVYGVVNRICKTIETFAMSSAYKDFIKHTNDTNDTNDTKDDEHEYNEEDGK